MVCMEEMDKMTVAETATEETITADVANEAEPDVTEFSKDDIFHILQNERRRNVLRFLADVEGQVEMRDVAEQVAAWEHDTTLESLTSVERQRVYIALYQSHLPKLDKMGVIDYNQSRGIVERRPEADQLTRYLDVDDDEEGAADRDDVGWQNYYFGLSSVGAVLLGLTALEVSVFSVLSPIAAGVIVLALFTLLTVGQFVDDRLSV